MTFLFEILIFIGICFISTISLAGLGQLIIYKIDKNFFESTFYGFIIISLLTTSIHFFFKISIFISIIIFLLGFFIGIKVYLFSKTKINNKFSLYLIFFLIFVPIYISQKFHEDFGYYHLPYIINFISEKIIFGLANINLAFVGNSIWLNILPIFYMENNYNFVTIPTFLSYFLFITFSIEKIFTDQQKKISNYYLIVSIFYLILKFTRISEYGNDIPAIVFSILSIYNFIRFHEEKEIQIQKEKFFSNLSFAFFAILIKFSSIPILLFTIYLFFKNFKILKNDIFKLNYLLIYFVCFIFFIQQFIYTGCFIFPSNFSCLNVSWLDENFVNAKYRLGLINKSYFATTARDIMSEKEYLNNFNWIPFWFKRSYTGMFEHLLTMIMPLILFLFFLKKSKIKENFKILNLKIFFLITIAGFFFWLNMSPVYRFGIIHFIGLVFLSTFLIYRKKSFNKKIFVIFISLFLFFNFSKNIKRIMEEEEIFLGIKKIENEFIPNVKFSNNIIPVYQPDILANANKGNGWQGRLCWDIKFICTMNRILISKNRNYLVIKNLGE